MIVELDGGLPEDNSLVLAIHREQTYVRRLLHIADAPHKIVLASETEDPRRRPPTLVVRTEEVRLLKIVGVLFDETPLVRRAKAEAVLDDDYTLLEKVMVVFRPRGESATPLVLEDQIVLGGRRVTPQELASFNGKPIALATSEGTVFKRVGAPVAGIRHVRRFEAIGGLGESILVRVEQREKDPLVKLPLFIDAREALGVVYEPRAGSR